MRPFITTDLDEKRKKEQEEERKSLAVDRLGFLVVQERLARLAAEQKVVDMGKQLVALKLEFAAFKGGSA
ncbi:hypothetical protein [Metabacillus fastidiosus]|uniref:hypothetical protein n=1 Tax=Metabacillus fastidiosus TaxID=1458 RepID=UPI003D273578